MHCAVVSLVVVCLGYAVISYSPSLRARCSR